MRWSGEVRSAVFGAGVMLELIRDGAAVTRSDLVRRTGLSRSTVAHRLGVVLVADLGATHARLALTDLAGGVLVEEAHDLDIAQGPEAVLGGVHDRFGALLEQSGR